MEFVQSAKATAQQIIKLSEKLGSRTHTWDQESSAPESGFTDRAGFIVYDDIALFADVYISEGKSLLRARLAREYKSEVGEELFTIITLDFNSDPEKTKTLIDNSDNLTQQMLTTLLNDPGTTPEHIQVSLDSGKGTDGNIVGKRYEYYAEELQEMNDTDRSEFIQTLTQAYDQILSKTTSS